MIAYPDLLEDRLSHLPLRKRRELALVSKILFEEFERAQTAKTRKRHGDGRILKIILFGSHARGDWVEDRIGGYFSDFDILVVVSGEVFAEPDFWYRANDRLLREELVTRRIKTPVEPIVHSYGDMNSQIAMGRPFFLDILRDGVVLYETVGFAFARPGTMTEEQKQKEAQKYFDEWYIQSQLALENAKSSFEKTNTYGEKALKFSAFLAHQATESIYHCLLLTLKLYSPKLHNIRRLHSLAVAIVPGLADVWPQDKQFYRRAFERLYDAYIKARYSPKFEITEEELTWLFERIEDLQNRVREICEAHLRQGAEAQHKG